MCECECLAQKSKNYTCAQEQKGGRGWGGDDDATTPSGGSPDIWADSKSKLREQGEEVLDGPHL